MNEQVCQACGAVVLDTYLHDSFHRKVPGGVLPTYVSMPHPQLQQMKPQYVSAPKPSTSSATFDMADFRRIFGVKVSETPDHFESIGEVDDYLDKVD